jgi:hypothetical protein
MIMLSRSAWSAASPGAPVPEDVAFATSDGDAEPAIRSFILSTSPVSSGVSTLIPDGEARVEMDRT